MKENEKAIIHTYWESPCGLMDLGSLGDELVMSDWVQGWHRETTLRRFRRLTGLPFAEGETPVIAAARDALDAYFAGRIRTFDLPIRFIGSDFQVRVWKALLTIPYGETATYGEIARAAGSPKAVRGTGTAVGANPFSVIVPCHRVVGASGSLTGYGGGYAAKRRLLALEMGIDESALPFSSKGCNRE